MEKVKNNDVLKSLRYILDIDDKKMAEIFQLGGYSADEEYTAGLLAKEDRENFTVCSDNIMSMFLNGLIIYERGPSDKPAPAELPELTNNLILKKLRIAFDLKEEDMMEVFNLGDSYIGKEELSGLFRREGHKHFIECSTKHIKDFLKGLTVRYRS